MVSTCPWFADTYDPNVNPSDWVDGNGSCLPAWLPSNCLQRLQKTLEK